jgi:hypothetical protein
MLQKHPDSLGFMTSLSAIGNRCVIDDDYTGCFPAILTVRTEQREHRILTRKRAVVLILRGNLHTNNKRALIPIFGGLRKTN